MLNLKAPFKVKVDVYLSIFLFQEKSSLFLWNLGHPKCSEKSPGNVFLKIMALMWKQVCWLQNSKCAFHGILALYMHLVKYYGYVEYKDWPHKRVTKKNMPFWQFYIQKNFLIGTVIKKNRQININTYNTIIYHNKIEYFISTRLLQHVR